MLDNDIRNIFLFLNFSIRYFQDPVFLAILKKSALNTGSWKYQKENV